MVKDISNIFNIRVFQNVEVKTMANLVLKKNNFYLFSFVPRILNDHINNSVLVYSMFNTLSLTSLSDLSGSLNNFVSIICGSMTNDLLCIKLQADNP